MTALRYGGPSLWRTQTSEVSWFQSVRTSSSILAKISAQVYEKQPNILANEYEEVYICVYWRKYGHFGPKTLRMYVVE